MNRKQVKSATMPPWSGPYFPNQGLNNLYAALQPGFDDTLLTEAAAQVKVAKYQHYVVVPTGDGHMWRALVFGPMLWQVAILFPCSKNGSRLEAKSDRSVGIYSQMLASSDSRQKVLKQFVVAIKAQRKDNVAASQIPR